MFFKALVMTITILLNYTTLDTKKVTFVSFFFFFFFWVAFPIRGKKWKKK